LGVTDRLTWEDAATNCNSKYGSFLVSIGDRYEQYWLNEQFLASGEDTWIGLRYQPAGQLYAWAKSNETFKFDHWDRGNPGK
jgi:hypothetical protein